jgi:hypothetical protein
VAETVLFSESVEFEVEDLDVSTLHEDFASTRLMVAIPLPHLGDGEVAIAGYQNRPTCRAVQDSA